MYQFSANSSWRSCRLLFSLKVYSWRRADTSFELFWTVKIRNLKQIILQFTLLGAVAGGWKSCCRGADNGFGGGDRDGYAPGRQLPVQLPIQVLASLSTSDTALHFNWHHTILWNTAETKLDFDLPFCGWSHWKVGLRHANGCDMLCPAMQSTSTIRNGALLCSQLLQ